jgi:hypothetical protein
VDGLHSAIWTLMGSNPGRNSYTSTFMDLAARSRLRGSIRHDVELVPSDIDPNEAR